MISRILISAVLIVLYNLVTAHFYAQNCCEEGSPFSSAAAKVSAPAVAETNFMTAEEMVRTLNSESAWNYDLNSGDLQNPLDPQRLKFMDSLSEYLRENPEESILITGQFDSTEMNGGLLSSLGMTRATSIKNLFVERGVESRAVFTSDSQMIATEEARTEIVDGINITLNPSGHLDNMVSAELIDSLVNRYTDQPIRLYFKPNSDQLDMTEQQRKEVEDLIYLLDQNDEHGLEVLGHTDSLGPEDTNKALGLERANFISKLLVKSGIDKSRITLKSYGSGRPIAPNTNAVARAKNRRVEIYLDTKLVKK